MEKIDKIITGLEFELFEMMPEYQVSKLMKGKIYAMPFIKRYESLQKKIGACETFIITRVGINMLGEFRSTYESLRSQYKRNR